MDKVRKPNNSMNFTVRLINQENSSAQITQKTLVFYCCVRVRFRGKMFTESLLRNGLHNPDILLLRALPSNDSYL
jgi:hypothetical protein